MNARGHNERSFRLDALAADAREGLANVEKGEEFTIAGWLAYGHAMNEGRALFPGDREFGEWMRSANLAEGIHDHDRAAAMWAAANADKFEQARQRGNPRTIRGIHAKWKEIEAEREAEARKSAEAETVYGQEVGNGCHPEPVAGPSVGSPQDDELSSVHKNSDTSGSDNAGISAAHDAADGPAPDDEPYDPVHAEKLDAEDTADPHAKLRAEFRKLTDEAREDEWLGLRLENAELRARVRKQTSMIADLKGQLRDFQGDDKDEVIRRLQAAVKNAENAKWKALEDRDAYHRQLHAVKKERDAAQKSLEAQEVTL